MTDQTTDQRRAPVDLERAIGANVAAFLEAAPDAMVIVDPEGRIVLVNRQVEALFGYERIELIGQPVELLIPTRYRKNHPTARAAYRSEPRRRPMGAGLDLHAVRKDATEFPAEISLGPVVTADGVFVTAAIRDVTDRKKVEARFRGLLEAAPDAVVIVNREGTIVVVNSQTERLFDYSRAELIGQPVEMLVPERFRAAHPGHRGRYFLESRARAMGSGLDLWARRRDGSEFPVEISLSPLETPDGVLVSSTIRDVTERKRAEALRAQLAAIVDSSGDAIIGASLDRIILSWNRGAELIFGYTAGEAIGQPISLLHPAGRAGELLAWGERVESFETIWRRADGAEIDVSVTSSPIHDSRGHVVGVSKVARDISERKRAEAALARAKEATDEANRELEAFSHSVAHDLRAPLRGIDGFSQALLEDCSAELDEEGQRYLRRIRESAQHMGQLIESLLSLSRITRRDIRREPVGLHDLARPIAERLKATDPARNVDFRIGAPMTAIGDRSLLAAALENLLANAWKFTQNEAVASIEFSSERKSGQTVFFVRDNGAGFDMTFASKLFGVFQRLHTVDEFEGTGIGLATVQRIVRRHGGRIWAEGKVGEGATFYFTLNERGHQE